MNSTVTLSSKNQVTIPAWIVKELGFKKGEKLVVEKVGGQAIKFVSQKKAIENLTGVLYDPNRKPIKDLSTLIRKAKADYYEERTKKKGY